MSGHTPSPPVSGIILTGFMGAGKTTTGVLVAARLGWRFVDSDRVIEEQAQRTIAEIFAGEGESAFRSLEAQVIREIAGSGDMVLALGGGALEQSATRDFLHSLPGRRMVFLDAPFEVLIGRCGAQENAPVRPVLQERERLAARWHARLPFYRQADLTVATAGLSPDAVAENILEAVFSGRMNSQTVATAGRHGGVR